MYQYENHKNEKGLQRKLEVIYPKRTVLSLVIRHLITYYLIKNFFTFTIYIDFKGTGIFDLKRTQIYTHIFA
jgi:hypothetical protein